MEPRTYLFVPGNRPEVLLRRHPDEELLERLGVAAGIARNPMLRRDTAARQDDGAGADLFDHVEPVRAEENHSPVCGEQLDERTKQQARVHVVFRDGQYWSVRRQVALD